jgi:hypothetical protein
MSLLTRAITSHQLEEIAELIKAHPEMVHETVNGWLPIEWAERTGNLYVHVRTARLIGQSFTPESSLEKLKAYISVISSTEYERIPKEAIPTMVWKCLYEGKSFTVDRWGRRFIPSKSHDEDLRFLCASAGISSAVQLETLLK